MGEGGRVSLALFFTGGVGLGVWAAGGHLDREVELYRRLTRHLNVSFVTYGGSGDRKYLPKLGGIRLLDARWYSLPKTPLLGLTVLHLNLKHGLALRDIDVYKTNQIVGSDVAIWFKKRYRKKLIVRCGYLHSQFTKNRTDNRREIADAVSLEKRAFTEADVAVVSSNRDREYVLGEYGLDPGKILVVPNYVVAEVFKPLPDVKVEYDLVYVGRAVEQKNLLSLLKALHILKKGDKSVRLLMVGGCSNNLEIREKAVEYGLDVTYAGSVPNFELPVYLNRSKAFILPSLYEGHPKALLEAMGCGLPCIGADVPGIREDIEHLKTGCLCGTDPRSISEAVEYVLGDESLRHTLGVNARDYVLKNYSLDRVFSLELDVIKKVVGGGL